MWVGQGDGGRGLCRAVLPAVFFCELKTPPDNIYTLKKHNHVDTRWGFSLKPS